MASVNEMVQQLNQANAQLAAANSMLTDGLALVAKVGTETDRLKEQLANLPPPGDASPEFVAAVEGIKATAATTADLVGQTKTALGAVDAKVDDAP